jgi:hypothetical protein
LAVIHTAASGNSGTIQIDPFDYQPQQQLDVLLQVPDDVLLRVTSTSPLCESERFCSDLRRTISFVNRVPSQHVFRQGQPLVYTRSATAMNDWELSTADNNNNNTNNNKDFGNGMDIPSFAPSSPSALTEALSF